MRRHGKSLTAAVLLLSATAGCGSTAQQPVTAPSTSLVVPPSSTGGFHSPSSADETGGSSSGMAEPGGVGSGERSDGSMPTDSGGERSAKPARGSGSVSRPPRSARINYDVPGVTDSTVRVGITYASDASTFAKVLNPNAQLADVKAVANSIIHHVNAQGGIFGRRIDPVFVDEKISDESSNEPAAEQAVCTAMTQDTRVAWAIDNVASQVNPLCFAKAKTPLFDANIAPLDSQAVAAAAPYYHALVSVNAKIYERVFVDRLVAQGYFTGWNVANRTPSKTAPVKIGVEYPDDPVSTRIYQHYLVPALRAHGLKVAAAFAMSSNLVARSQTVTAQVLRLRSAGVTHLITLGPMAFTAGAGTNGWHPRLAFDTNNQTAGNGGHPEYFKGALGVGWSPVADLGPGARGVARPTNNACLGWVHHDLGYSLVGGDPGIYAEVAALCDGILIPVHAMRAARGFSPADIQAGLSATYRKTPSVSALSQGLDATHWSGVTEVRDFAFDEHCYCNRYRRHVTRLR